VNLLRGSIPRCLRNPVLQIAALGTLSWLTYLHLSVSYPLSVLVSKYPLTDFGRANNWSVPSLADFLLSILGAFGLYILTWRVVRRHPRHRRLLWLVLGFGALSALTLLTMYPITATDVFEYVFHSRILVHYGQNPLAVPPAAFKGDPFLKTVNWALHPSPYGPLWVILTVPGSLLGGNDLLLNLVLMRGLTVLFYFACAVVIAAILRTKDPQQQVGGTLLFAWNPLILFEAPGNGHNGIIMMFFALLAIYFLVKRQWVWVIPVLVASVLVKYITAILLLPFLIYCWRAQEGRRNQLVYLAKTSLVSALVVGVLALPFLSVPSGLLEEANFYSLLAVPTLAYNILKGIHGDQIAKILTITVSVGSYLLLYGLSLRVLAHNPRPRGLILLSTWLTVAYLGIACMHYQPWFTVWPIALGIWINHSVARRVLIVFTASALLSYAANFFWIWNIRTLQTLQVNVMFVLVIFVPPFLVGLLSQVWEARLSSARTRSPAEVGA
jgi:alpha-1,6-mannosyltransferase